MNAEFQIGTRSVGPTCDPLVIAEIGINHNGDIAKAIQMVDDAVGAGCECVKFQCHILEDEMLKNNVIPANAKTSIWEVISSALLSSQEEQTLKRYVEQRKCIYLSTPFSRAAAIRLEKMGVLAYKIGSGECNNYPLIKHIASYGKPVILSTGMNDFNSIDKAVNILRSHNTPFGLLQCTSIYPTPPDKLNIGALLSLRQRYPDAVIGFSDHSTENYSAFASIALGGCILEKHFTSDKKWPGPDNSMSIDPIQLRDLVVGVKVVKASMGSTKKIWPEEQPTIDFAYASVVSIKAIAEDDILSKENIWVKRPGTGRILAKEYSHVIGRRAKFAIPKDTQLDWSMIHG